MNINESFEIHDELNPALFDNAGILKPDVREKIIEIVGFYEKNLEIPIFIADIQLCGSNASYNWTPTSDLDVHIIANMEDVDASKEILTAAYNMSKAKFNSEYDIKIHGIEVELYVQDIKSNVLSNGIYSVCDNAWIKVPKPMNSASKKNVEKELEKWTNHISNVVQEADYDKILECINTLYLIRHNSLAVEGEQGKGN